MDKEKGTPAELRRRIKLATYATLRDLTSNSSIAVIVVICAWVFDFTQLLVSGPMSPRTYFPWHLTGMLQAFYNFVLPLVLVPDGTISHSATALFIAVSVWLGLTLLLFVWSLLGHLGYSSYQPTWRLTLLKGSVLVGLHLLWVPLAGTLLSPFACSSGDSWLGTGVACYSSTHMGLFIAALIALPLFVTFTAGMTLLMVNRVPNGKDALCQPTTGRPMLALLLIRLVLIATYVLGPGFPASAHIAVCTLCGVAWLSVILYALPFHIQTLNRLQCAFAMAFITTALVTAAATGMDQADCHVGAIAFFMLLPFTLFTGAALASMRFRAVGTGNELSNPYLVYLRTAYLLQEDQRMAGIKFFKAYRSNRSAAAADISGGRVGGDPFYSGAPPPDHSAIGVGDNDVSGGDDRMTARSGTTGNTRGSRRTGGTGTGRLQGVPDHDHNVYTRGQGEAERERQPLSPMMQVVEYVYTEAAALLQSSATFSLILSTYHGVVRSNRHLERVHLKKASGQSPAPDIEWFIYQRLAALDEQEQQREAGGTMTIEKRVQVEALTSEVRHQVAAVRHGLLAFWTALATHTPDLSSLQRVGSQLRKGLQATDDTFKALLALSPGSPSIMRLYAEFLLVSRET